MKVFEVIYEEDGETTKVPGTTTTEIKRTRRYFAAQLIGEVWTAVADIVTGPGDRTLVSIAEVLPAVTIIGSTESEAGNDVNG